MAKGIGGHQSAKMLNDEWLTPPELIMALGTFDLDPCAPIVRPWDTATKHYTIEDNGLVLPWFGRVWLNPPYGRMLGAWMERMQQHRQGIALIFGRTDTQDFHKYVFPAADSILFLEGRLHFHNVLGERAKANSGAPSVLVAYGEQNVEALEYSSLKGKHLFLNTVPLIVIGDKTWKETISVVFCRLNSEASIQKVYELVATIAPTKVAANANYKAKIRQVLQRHFNRVGKGIYKQKAA